MVTEVFTPLKTSAWLSFPVTCAGLPLMAPFPLFPDWSCATPAEPAELSKLQYRTLPLGGCVTTADTPRLVLPVIPLKLAAIVVVPVVTPVASPLLFTVATLGVPELQVA